MFKLLIIQLRMPIAIVMGILFFSFVTQVSFAQDLKGYCEESYLYNAECPEDVCTLGYFHLENNVAYVLRCTPKDCMYIDAEKCPLDKCQLMMGCSGEDVCFDQIDDNAPECGGLAYEGQKSECCKGFVKRCGVEFFDGSCDMEGKFTVDSIPICLPCGNGICNQFENRCNCPEDCSPKD